MIYMVPKCIQQWLELEVSLDRLEAIIGSPEVSLQYNSVRDSSAAVVVKGTSFSWRHKSSDPEVKKEKEKKKKKKENVNSDLLSEKPTDCRIQRRGPPGDHQDRRCLGGAQEPADV